MKEVDRVIYQALRDDSEATYGIRTLLGNTTTSPYNVYRFFLPSGIDFSAATSQSYVTFFPVSTNYDMSFHAKDARAFQSLYQFTVWSRSVGKCYDVVERIKWRLDRMQAVGTPSVDAGIIGVKFEGVVTETFDNDYKVHLVICQARIWGRDDTDGR